MSFFCLYEMDHSVSSNDHRCSIVSLRESLVAYDVSFLWKVWSATSTLVIKKESNLFLHVKLFDTSVCNRVLPPKFLSYL